MERSKKSAYTVKLTTEPMPQGLPGIVPVLLEQEENLLRVECYAEVEDTVRAFLHHSQWGDPFSDAALSALWEALTPYFASVGYTQDGYGKLRYYESYRMDGERQPPKALLLPGCSLLTEEIAALPNRTTFALPLLFKRSAPCAVQVADGQVVAVCAVNDFEPDCIPEVTVETAVGYRGRGYGKSVTAALCRELRQRGYPVAYCCSRYHRASKKLAKALGFRWVGRFYAVTGYR